MSTQTPVSSDASHARPSTQSKHKASKVAGPQPTGPLINFQYQKHVPSRPATTSRPAKPIVAEPVQRTNFLASAFRILGTFYF
jgi:hypothetical protein